MGSRTTCSATASRLEYLGSPGYPCAYLGTYLQQVLYLGFYLGRDLPRYLHRYLVGSRCPGAGGVLGPRLLSCLPQVCSPKVQVPKSRARVGGVDRMLALVRACVVAVTIKFRLQNDPRLDATCFLPSLFLHTHTRIRRFTILHFRLVGICNKELIEFIIIFF